MHRIDGAGATGDNKFTEGDPTQAVPATTVTAAWLNAVQEELAQAIEQLGLALSNGDDTQLWQALQKVYGKTHAGNPQGSLAADVVRERCWDTSVSPPALYIATAADGTIGGTTWTRLIGAASSAQRGLVELATNTETKAGTDSQRAVTPAGLASFDQLLLQDGYQKLPGGLILQWGRESSVDDGDTISFPTQFPTGVFVILATEITGSGLGSAAIAVVGVETDTITTSSFVARLRDPSSTQLMWMAIGR